MARSNKREEETHPEWEEKVLYINRCSTVVKGGRKFSFSALVVIGDRKGRVGLGFAKANEVADAIRKGGAAARQNVISFELDEATIPHELHVKWDGAHVFLKPARKGTGIIAGSKVRTLLELSGIADIVTKNLVRVTRLIKLGLPLEPSFSSGIER